MTIGASESVTAATRRIIDIEGYPDAGIHWEMYVYTLRGRADADADAETFATA